MTFLFCVVCKLINCTHKLFKLLETRNTSWARFVVCGWVHYIPKKQQILKCRLSSLLSRGILALVLACIMSTQKRYFIRQQSKSFLATPHSGSQRGILLNMMITTRNQKVLIILRSFSEYRKQMASSIGVLWRCTFYCYNLQPAR